MDYDFLSVSNGSGDAALMHVTNDRLTGSTIIQVDSVVNVPTKFIGTYGTLGPDGLITSASKRDFKGHISSGNLVIDAFEPGSTDAGNTAGQIVIVKPNTGWANRVAQFIKNAKNFGTPEDSWFANITGAVINAVSQALSGGLTVGGNTSLTGNLDIGGTSRLIPVIVTTADGSNNITPSKQKFGVSALAANATVQVPSWSAQDMMQGEIRIKDNGTARSLVWASGWASAGPTLPNTTIAGKWLWVSYEYNAVDSKFYVVSITRQP